MLSIFETPTFVAEAAKIWAEDERLEFFSWIATEPEAGAVIAGSGGCRKVRWSRPGMGKQGGARVIYYYLDDTMPLYALLAYAKNAKDDMTPNEKRAVSALVTAIKATRKEMK